jgi:fructan beta-fructosidase
LIVNLNPGGPNGGSATQYFLGDFDGKTFTPAHTDTRWLDYGPDEYAGVTWNNTGDRRLFLGWMSNWLYAERVPTQKWRSAMTIPRDLSLRQAGNEWYVASKPSGELSKIQARPRTYLNLQVADSIDLAGKVLEPIVPCRIDLDMDKIADLSLVLSNEGREQVVVGFDKKANQYFVDRSRSGKADFHKEFARRHVAPRIAKGEGMDMTLVVDVSSVELFADDGLSVMTAIFFLNKPFSQVHLKSSGGAVLNKLDYIKLASTYK